MFEFARFKVTKIFVGLPGREVPTLSMDAHGIHEDKKHYGPTLIAGPRVRKGAPKVPKGEIDENWRKFSAISEFEVATVKKLYEKEYNRALEADWAPFFGANMLIKGVERLSECPTGSILDFDNDGPTLAITTENTACKNPGKNICATFGLPNEDARNFVKFCKGRRGVVGTVLSPGVVIPGAQGLLYFPGARYDNVQASPC